MIPFNGKNNKIFVKDKKTQINSLLRCLFFFISVYIHHIDLYLKGHLVDLTFEFIKEEIKPACVKNNNKNNDSVQKYIR